MNYEIQNVFLYYEIHKIFLDLKILFEFCN